ncbi:ATP-binding protein [Mycetocola sp. 2940]|uniref:ATP-binding protein n=1 Tax=Mycetocola sp. 2940 TaxID=3156452 RepID=UPI00339B39F3
MTGRDAAGAPVLSLDDAVALVLARCTRAVETVLLDGPSGAGKSTLADALVVAWPGAVSLVRMDNIYPGWGGLAAGSEQVHDSLLEPRYRGADSRWRRHDWENDRPAEWHTVPVARSLLLEGCGALSRRNAPLATLRVWLDADDGVRKDRALARDRGGFDAHWDDWQRQFARFVADDDPITAADLRIRLP